MKFSQPIAEGILKDIADGIPYKISCESFGVSYDSFKLWLREGAKAQLEGKNTIYSQFLTSVRKVQKNIISGHLEDIRGSDKGHRGKEWELERSYWMHFSSKAAEIDLNERVEELEQKRGLENVVEAKANEGQEERSSEEVSSNEEVS